jgi:hypothetical protein
VPARRSLLSAVDTPSDVFAALDHGCLAGALFSTASSELPTFLTASLSSAAVPPNL